VPSARRAPTRQRGYQPRLGTRLLRPAPPSPVAWWKADSLALSNGAAVTSWTDSSGNGQTLAQATGALQPTYVTNVVGGNPVVRFDGTRYLDATITTRTQPNTWFVVLRPSTTAAMANVTSGGEEILVDAGGLVEVWGGASSVSNITATAGSWLAVGVQINGASSAIWSDNTAGTIGSLGTDPTGTALRVGNHTSLSRFFTGDIAEIILYNQVLSATDRASVFSYLHAKYLSGSAFTTTVDDTTGVTDAGQIRTLTATGTDTAGLTDSASSSLTSGFTRTVDDPAGLTDTATGVSAFARTQDDTAGLTDSRALAQAATVTDTAGLTDPATPEVGRTITDTVGLTDAASSAAGFARTVDDSAGLTDSNTPVLTPAGPLARTVDDPAGLVDTRALDVTATATDSTGVTDAGVAQGRTAAGTDDAGLTDSVSASLTSTLISRTVDDTTGITDLGAPQAVDIAETINDTAGLTDSTSAQLAGTGTRTIDDNAGLTDTRALDVTATVTDTAGLTDSRALAQTATVTDTAGLTDAASSQLAGAGTRQIDDSAGLTDTLALTGAATVNDTGRAHRPGGRGQHVHPRPDRHGGADGLRHRRVRQVRHRQRHRRPDRQPGCRRRFARTQDDPAGLVDAFAQALAAVRTVDDLLGLVDAAVQGGVNLRTQTDTAGLTDTVSAVIASSLNQTVNDSVGLRSDHRAVLTTHRPATGVTARPSSGTTARPYTGVTSRYPFIPD
jgi:hypothetical protein